MTDNESFEDIEMLGRMMIALERLEQCKDLSLLIPEVRTNLVFARVHARDHRDVLAVDGRLTVVNGMPKAAGNIRFGASSHLARFIIYLMKTHPQIRAAINFSNNPAITIWLEEYCSHVDWTIVRIDRNHEPAKTRNEEGNSMMWKAGHAVRMAGGHVPKVICDAGGMGKEPVCIIVGQEPVHTARELCGIAHAWAQRDT
ncbi:thiamine-phosphate synthase family protein [uncultured Methanoregula sp.]|uniref:thiamine-phosphate synthase family protein n=1 Tax=uncultured Methanoregula sp. TaxID=1005933 RepID=UPI002AABA89B|nr:thiamine-phosphate synthase family protein [uncultured Methanoregula sp.]